MTRRRKVDKPHLQPGDKRKGETKDTRQVFLLACEGKKTEPDYFNLLRRGYDDSFIVEYVPHDGGTVPVKVLERMKSMLDDPGTGFDEAWIVADTDNLPDEQLQPVREWADSRHSYNVAWSNPKFEYWLILHYDDPFKSGSRKKSGKKKGSRRPPPNRKQDLKSLFKSVSGYNDGGDLPGSLLDGVESAIGKAKTRMNEVKGYLQVNENWTSVRLLVERMLPPQA